MEDVKVRPAREWDLKYSFDRELVKNISGKLNEFERMLLALTCDNINVSNIARHLEIKPSTLNGKKKRLLLRISNDIKTHYKNHLPVPYKRIEALLNEFKEEGDIFYPKDNAEFKRAYNDLTRYSNVRSIKRISHENRQILNKVLETYKTRYASGQSYN